MGVRERELAAISTYMVTPARSTYCTRHLKGAAAVERESARERGYIAAGGWTGVHVN